ncbi:M20/M25/M40 family metallo-hydrolase, partial [Nocardia sp. NPDC059246]|uniref:M20/M25/M40 family metallo-hydrolase n=1 Tax=unclassified Nocardia TaxID=2637762 RepID=UPI0036B3B046
IGIVRDLLRVPGISTTGEGMAESAEACLAHLKRVAPDARLVETGGYPTVYGRSRSSRPDAKTLLIYCLYDETPVDFDQWKSDPFGANIVEAEQLGLDPSMGAVICGRAASNHRGPMLSTILAVEAMQRIGGDLPLNIVWLWEGEEEIGSPNLGNCIKQQHDDIMECDGMWLPAMHQRRPGGSMPLYRGVRGLNLVELECRGGEWGGVRDGRHIWSGWLPFVDAPMMRLIHAVGSLYDADHKLTIDGLAERLDAITAEEREQIKLLEDATDASAEKAMKQVVNVNELRGGRSMQELIPGWVSNPQINIQGFHGGYDGPHFYTMMPQNVSAKIDVRLPGGVSPEQLQELLKTHLHRRGFPEIAVRCHGYEAQQTDVEDEICQAAIRAAATCGVQTQIWPASNGCAPHAFFGKEPYNLPCSIAGLGHGGNIHAPDEYITVGSIRAHMDFTVNYLHEWASGPT